MKGSAGMITKTSFAFVSTISAAHRGRWWWRKGEVLWAVHTWNHGSKWRWNRWCYHRRSRRGFPILVRGQILIETFSLSTTRSILIMQQPSFTKHIGLYVHFASSYSGFLQLCMSHWSCEKTPWIRTASLMIFVSNPTPCPHTVFHCWTPVCRIRPHCDLASHLLPQLGKMSTKLCGNSIPHVA